MSAGLGLGAGLAALVGSACAGALFSVHRAAAVPPAEAMRPEPPLTYRRSVFERPRWRTHLPHLLRMVLRNVERRPWRAVASVAGIASAVAIFFFGLVFLKVLSTLVDQYFFVSQRQDLTVTLIAPLGSSALAELRRLPGVVDAEPVRVVVARLRHGARSRPVPITGSRSMARLSRVVTLAGDVVALPPEGVLLSRTLADILQVRPGDTLQLEVLEGDHRTHEAAVAGVVDDMLGLWAVTWRSARCTGSSARESACQERTCSWTPHGPTSSTCVSGGCRWSRP